METEKRIGNVPDVNAHIHSPYSFSAFKDLRQAFEMARREKVMVLGINDFNTTGGFPEFYSLSMEFGIFPLFNIEFMGLLEDEQVKGIRINDPNNPGRIYFSGKGLDFPVSMNSSAVEKLERVNRESQRQVREMTEKLSHYLSRRTGSDTRNLILTEILAASCKVNIVRERHIAQALRIAIFRKGTGRHAERKNFLTGIMRS
jgi:hypothetical protein